MTQFELAGIVCTRSARLLLDSPDRWVRDIGVILGNVNSVGLEDALYDSLAIYNERLKPDWRGGELEDE